MEKKVYLEEFLDKLTKMVQSSTTAEQKEVCVKYIDNYKTQIKEVIENELFMDATLDFLDELINQVNNEGSNRTAEEGEEEIL